MRTLWEDHHMEFECHYRSIVNISEDSMNVHAHPLRPQQKICIVSKSLSFARILLGGEVTLEFVEDLKLERDNLSLLAKADTGAST